MTHLLDPALSTRRSQTPQMEPRPGQEHRQVQNSAGGFVYQIDDFDRLRRFLILGSEGGTFYAGQRELTTQNAKVVARCLAADAARTVAIIAQISDEGLAPKQDYAIFALAMAASPDFNNSEVARRLALNAVDVVCRTGTQLFHFAAYVEQFRGWGRGLRRAVANWYEREDVQKLAYQAVKYRQRDGWSHRDLLRLSHPDAPSPVHQALYTFITKGELPDTYVDTADNALGPVEGFEILKGQTDADEIAATVAAYRLPHEAIPTEFKNNPKVQAALLESGMPLTALIRNLGNYTKSELLTPTSVHTGIVLDALANEDALRKARVHPITILAALQTYKSGHGFRGQNTWIPVPKIVDALDAAFYAAFKFVEPTNQRHLLSIDISGSMDWADINGIPGLTPRVGAAAMALVTANVEPYYETTVFSSGGYGGRYGYRNQGYDGIQSVALSSRQRLDDALATIEAMPAGGTDCALPMLWAAKHNREVDVFVIYTDNETWAGSIQPMEALRDYRQKSGINAKLVVCGMTATEFSIADPEDGGALDVVGFDSSAPATISEFVKGNL